MVTNQQIIDAINHSTNKSMAEVGRNLGMSPSNFVRRATRLGVYKPTQVSPFKGVYKVPFDKLKERSIVKARLIEEDGEFCHICGMSKEWQGKQLVGFELHHIDGNGKNNARENVQLLCPNCHSTTDNYKQRGRKCE